MTAIRVFIRDLEVLAHIGVHRHEQGMAQPVRINVWLEVDASVANDRLENVVDYEQVAGRIRALVAADHINLAETLTLRIADICLEDARVVRVTARVEKLHALSGAASAGVEIERRRE